MYASIVLSNIAVPALAEPRFYVPPRLRYPPFDRADPRLQHRGDLLVLVITGRSEQQAIPQLWRPPVDRAFDVLSQTQIAEHLLRRSVAARNLEVVAEVVRRVRLRPRNQAPPGRELSPPVDRLVPCDGQQPRPEARFSAKAGKGAVRREKRVLRGILGVGRGAEHR